MTNEKLDIMGLFGETTDFSKPNQKSSKLTTKIPDSTAPLVVKFIGDPRGKGRYVPMEYYSYQIGPDREKDGRTRASMKSVKLVDRDPELDVYFETLKEIKALKETSPNDTDAMKALEAKRDLYKSKEGGWIHYVEPNSDEVRCLKIGKAIINTLFGRKAYGTNVPEIPSLLAKLSQDGNNPYNIRSDSGWLKIYKTGEGMATRYVVELDQVDAEVEVGGKKVKVQVPREHAVHQKIKTSDLTLSDFPDPIEFEKRGAFTEEETMQFIESEGTYVPERVIKRGKDATSSTTETTSGVSLTETITLDDIPF